VFSLLFTAVLAASPEPAPMPRPSGWVPTIVQIMDEAHRCRTNYVGQVTREAGKDDPDWEAAGVRSRDLIRMGELLAKNTPPRGSADSWEHFTTLYVANARLMADAAEKRRKDDVLYHTRKLRAMCAECHKKHADW